MICPFCGMEATYSVSSLTLLPKMVENKVKLLCVRRAGGQFVSSSCGHTWPVESLSRQGPISLRPWRV